MHAAAPTGTAGRSAGDRGHAAWLLRYVALVGLGLVALARVDTTPLCVLLARAAGALLALTGTEAWTQGIAVHGRAFSLQVASACDGTDVCVLLGAAMLATAAVPWRRRLAGVGLALVLTELVNAARIAALFVVGTRVPDLFEAAHQIFWQAAMMLWAVFFYARWR
jgi:exosortase/archaeosortase family protein